MEGMGVGASCIDGDWESICRLLSMDQDPDFTNFLGQDYHNDELMMAGDPNFDMDQQGLYNLSLSSCSSDDQIYSFYSDADDFLVNKAVLTIEDPMENADELITMLGGHDHDQVPAEPKKKKARVSKNGKGKKQAQEDEEEEEEKSKSNGSDEGVNDGSTYETAKSSIVKKRSCRGAATDPQSLYARRRRERINERLRILQTLVPNGTKVDISTMLEEAIHYVKFLQAQIKLLGSDEMWMYAPQLTMDLTYVNRSPQSSLLSIS